MILRFYSLTLPITTITLFGIGSAFHMGALSWRLLKKNTALEIVKIVGLTSFLGATANSIAWRAFEGPALENSAALSSLADKYNFSIYDFAVAKKESHVKKLLEVLDSHHETLHSE